MMFSLLLLFVAIIAQGDGNTEGGDGGSGNIWEQTGDMVQGVGDAATGATQEVLDFTNSITGELDSMTGGVGAAIFSATAVPFIFIYVLCTMLAHKGCPCMVACCNCLDNCWLRIFGCCNNCFGKYCGFCSYCCPAECCGAQTTFKNPQDVVGMIGGFGKEAVNRTRVISTDMTKGVGGLLGGVQNAVSGVANSASGLANNAANRAGGLANSATTQLGQLGNRVGEQVPMINAGGQRVQVVTGNQQGGAANAQAWQGNIFAQNP